MSGGVLTKLSEILEEFAKNSSEEFTVYLELQESQFEQLLRDANAITSEVGISVKEVEFAGPGGSKVIIKKARKIQASELSSEDRKFLNEIKESDAIKEAVDILRSPVTIKEKVSHISDLEVMYGERGDVRFVDSEDAYFLCTETYNWLRING